MGKVPYGYVRDDDSKLVVPEPVQAVMVRRNFELYVTGRKGIKSIANAGSAQQRKALLRNLIKGSAS
jgi:hypothetical protein